MKSIKEKAEEFHKVIRVINEHESIVNTQGSKMFIEGANYVLDEIENFMKDLDLGNSAEEKFYKLDVLADIHGFIEQLKK